ncbi:hypothetical protein ABZW30_30420 [Kitasatospora sp. NPDC004669]|uniref:hypothetical protein n=1 Tax=Kitasatospora sp. NPDC004669 TaxID=3154555 RepID=UPI0033AA9E2B
MIELLTAHAGDVGPAVPVGVFADDMSAWGDGDVRWSSPGERPGLITGRRAAPGQIRAR